MEVKGPGDGTTSATIDFRCGTSHQTDNHCIVGDTEGLDVKPSFQPEYGDFMICTLTFSDSK